MHIRHRTGSCIWLVMFLAFVLLSGARPASAFPVTVSYSATGAAGDWTLDFSVTNNLVGSNHIYQFGVQLSANNIVGTPVGSAWSPNTQFYGFTPLATTTYNLTAVIGGAPNIDFNNLWARPFIGGVPGSSPPIFPGTTLPGFQVHITDEAVPTFVNWYVYTWATGVDSVYGGGESICCGNQSAVFVNSAPVGEIITTAVVPAPGALALLGFGLVCLWASRRRLI